MSSLYDQRVATMNAGWSCMCNTVKVVHVNTLLSMFIPHTDTALSPRVDTHIVR